MNTSFKIGSSQLKFNRLRIIGEVRDSFGIDRLNSIIRGSVSLTSRVGVSFVKMANSAGGSGSVSVSSDSFSTNPTGAVELGSGSSEAGSAGSISIATEGPGQREVRILAFHLKKCDRMG